MSFVSNGTTFFSNSSGTDLYLACGATQIDFASVPETGEVNGEGAAISWANTLDCSDFTALNDTGTNWDDVSQIPNPPGTQSICGADIIRGGTIGALPCNSTLAVALADFSATQQSDAVLLTWETNSELNNRGFNLYRGTSAAGWDRQLNETLIPSQSQGNAGGFIYTWEDRTELVPGASYFYWVEDVNIYGAATRHGPVSVDYTVPTAVTVSEIQAGPAATVRLPWLWVAVSAGIALGLSRLRRRA